MQHLDLRDSTNLTRQGFTHLNGLTALQGLWLVPCSASTDCDFENLSGFTALKQLDLGGCHRSTDQSLVPLSTFSALQHLDLGKGTVEGLEQQTRA
jgi:hypothetical protein